jgi:hypothetical protein
MQVHNVIRHVTKASENLFIELGLKASEAALLKATSDSEITDAIRRNRRAAKNRSPLRLLKHILDGKPYGALLSSPLIGQHRIEWRALFTLLRSVPPRDRATSESFHSQWHACHGFIRELVDADELLLDALWVWLPRYEGSDMQLYRGENIDRLESGRTGSAWSSNLETAKCFASGLNAVAKGGVLLQTKAPVSAIIAGPSNHSIYLSESEFTIDTRKLIAVEELGRYPPIFAAA